MKTKHDYDYTSAQWEQRRSETFYRRRINRCFYLFILYNNGNGLTKSKLFNRGLCVCVASANPFRFHTNIYIYTKSLTLLLSSSSI